MTIYLIMHEVDGHVTVPYAFTEKTLAEMALARLVSQKHYGEYWIDPLNADIPVEE